MKEREILLFTGGLDSSILYFYLNKPKTLYFTSWHRYMRKEVARIREMVPDTIFDDSFFLKNWEYPNAHIPFRNLLFVLGAARSYDRIYLGGVVEDRVNDNTAASHLDMSAIASRYAERPIRVISPFTELGWSKFDAIRWLQTLMWPEEVETVLLGTLSCFDEREGRCMQCPACFRWYVALKWCGIPNVPVFLNREVMSEYRQHALEGLYGAETERTKAILELTNEI